MVIKAVGLWRGLSAIEPPPHRTDARLWGRYRLQNCRAIQNSEISNSEASTEEILDIMVDLKIVCLGFEKIISL